MITWNTAQKMKKGRQAYRFGKEYIEQGFTLTEITKRHSSEISYHTLKKYSMEYKWKEKRERFLVHQSIVQDPEEDPKVKAKVMSKYWDVIINEAVAAVTDLDTESKEYSKELTKLTKIIKEARLAQRLEDNQPNNLSAMQIGKFQTTGTKTYKRLVTLTDDTVTHDAQTILGDTGAEEIYLPGRGETERENNRGSADLPAEDRHGDGEVVSDGGSRDGKTPQGEDTDVSDHRTN